MVFVLVQFTCLVMFGLCQNPNIPLLFSMRRVLHLLALFYTGLLPFVPLRESFYEIIMPSILLKSVTVTSQSCLVLLRA